MVGWAEITRISRPNGMDGNGVDGVQRIVAAASLVDRAHTKDVRHAWPQAHNLARQHVHALRVARCSAAARRRRPARCSRFELRHIVQLDRFPPQLSRRATGTLHLVPGSQQSAIG